MKFTCIILCGLLVTTPLRSAEPEKPSGGALAGERFRVIVSTDVGGSDPDDFQSLVHYLVYADLFDTEGLISSPPHAGRAAHIHETLDAYAKDYPKLIKQSSRFPTPDALRAVTKQGATDPAPAAGWSEATEGSRWIIERARVADPRPLRQEKGHQDGRHPVRAVLAARPRGRPVQRFLGRSVRQTRHGTEPLDRRSRSRAP